MKEHLGNHYLLNCQQHLSVQSFWQQKTKPLSEIPSPSPSYIGLSTRELTDKLKINTCISIFSNTAISLKWTFILDTTASLSGSKLLLKGRDEKQVYWTNNHSSCLRVKTGASKWHGIKKGYPGRPCCLQSVCI